MTGIVYTKQDNSSELARKKYMAWMGTTILEIADIDTVTNPDPIGVEGWQVFGRATSADPSRTVNYVDLLTGSPQTSKGMVCTGDNLEYGITFDHLNLLGVQLANGSGEYVYTPQYATDGQDTVASAPTKNSCVLTTGTGLAVGDMVEIDLTYNTSYGQYKEVAFITSINATTKAVEFTRISQAPLVNADFKKIAGLGTGAMASANGIAINIGGEDPFRCKFRRTIFNTTNRSAIIEYFPQVEIINPTGIQSGDGTSLVTAGFTIKVLPYYETVTMKIGGTKETHLFGKTYIVPYES